MFDHFLDYDMTAALLRVTECAVTLQLSQPGSTANMKLYGLRKDNLKDIEIVNIQEILLI